MKSNLKPRNFKYRENRVSYPLLEAAVVYRKGLWQKENEYCDLLNISHGGICFACKRQIGNVGNKVEMNIFNKGQDFHIRGLITRKSIEPAGYSYGMVFIQAPVELDRLIDIFLADYVQKNMAPVLPEEEVPLRYRENRYSMKDTQIFARKYGTDNPFVLCRVENISKGGIGFFSQQQIDKEAPFPVSIQISSGSSIQVISGKVCYMNRKPEGYYYGVQYTMVTMDFVRILDTLENVLGEVDQ